MNRVRLFLLLLFGAIVLSVPGTAAAATVGDAEGGDVGCIPGFVFFDTEFPVQQQGTIRSISHRAVLTGERVTFLVLRPQGDQNYMVLGSTGEVTFAAASGLETFPIGSVAVQPGDILGFYVGDTGFSGCMTNAGGSHSGSANIGHQPGPGDVVQEQYANVFDGLNVQARLDPDGTTGLDVTTVGDGSVTSTPPGIDCGPDTSGDCEDDYEPGSEVTLTAAPSDGWTLDHWDGCDTVDGPTCTVTMDDAKSVTAQFSETTPMLTVTTDGDGTVTSSPEGIDCGSDCTEKYDAGTEVTLTATAADGAAFRYWTSGPCIYSDLPTCKVTMDTSQTVTAQFAPAHTLTIQYAGSGTGSANFGDRYFCPAADAPCTFALPENGFYALLGSPDAYSTLTGYSGDCTPFDQPYGRFCLFTMDQDKTLTVTFDAVPHLQVDVTGDGTVTSDPAGIDCPSDCDETYDSDTSVTLTATPADGARFAGWDGACSGETTAVCTVTMDQARSVSAAFEAIPTHTLTVADDPSDGGTVSSDTGGIDCPGTCSDDYAEGSQVTLTATPAEGYRFDHFTGCGGGLEAARAARFAPVNQCTVTMSADETVTAVFVQQYLLQVNNQAGDGSVTSDDSGAIDCPAACSAAYDAGTTVVLTAHSSADTDDFEDCDTKTATTCTVQMTSDRAVRIQFLSDARVEVGSTGNGNGAIASDDDNIDCDPYTDGFECAHDYFYFEGSPPTESVTLTATAHDGSTFAGFTGCPNAPVDDTCTFVPAHGTTNVTAEFNRTDEVLDVDSSVGGGTGSVQSDPTGIDDCFDECHASFAHGSTVTLTATPSDGSQFNGWDGCDDEDGNTCTVAMNDSRNVAAFFTTPQSVVHSITVTKAGSGTGTVTSDPEGIDCGGTCVADFEDDTDVTLTAVAADGSSFVGWDGCDSTDGATCFVHVEETGDDHQITATFTAATAGQSTLTTTVTGNGTGYVDSSPSGIDCQAPGVGGPHTACSASFPSGSQVTLTAHPADGTTFDGFTGCGRTETKSKTVSALTCTVTINGDRQVGASFTAQTGGGGGGGGGAQPTPTPAPTATATVTATATPGNGGHTVKPVKPTAKLRKHRHHKLKLRVHCGTTACTAVSATATISVHGTRLGSYDAPDAITVKVNTDGTITLTMSDTLRQALRDARKAHPHAHPIVRITITFTLADGTTVVRHIKLRLN